MTQSATNDITTVYYGAKTDTNLAAGTYSNTVSYTATPNLSVIPTPSVISVTPTNGTTVGGTMVQIVGTNFTVNDQSVTTAVAIGGQNCLNATISSNTPIAGQDSIYCNTPVHPTATPVDVAVVTWNNTATKKDGYTYIAPTPTITAPTAGQILNAGTTSTTLTVTTDVPGICYWGTAASPTTAMTTTGGTTHTQSITGLTNQSTNTRYVRCQAATGHSYGAEASVTFYVRAVTPVTPTVSPANGSSVPVGNTTITVTSTGAVCKWGTSSGSAINASGINRTTTLGTNTLYYSCVTGSGNTASLPLTGSWTYTGLSPTITSITGTMRGGNTITITGTGFFAGGSSSAIILPLTVGGAACYITSVTDTQVKCTMPTTLAAGSRTVSLRTNLGTATSNITYVTDTGYTVSQCSSLALNTTTTITDNRNGQSYTIKKLADGNCWMVSNLRYLPSGNAAGTYSEPASGKFMTKDGTNNTNNGNYDAPFYYVVSQGSQTNSANQDFFGYLYNWYGATAGTGNSNRTWEDTAESSICPSPFALPTGGSGLDYSRLDIAFGGTGANNDDPSDPATGVNLPYLEKSWFWAGPWKGVLAGYYFTDHWFVYEYARYWTASPVSSDAAYDIAFDQYGKYLRPGTDVSASHNGFAVRCVLKP
ncbi:MAG: IPT/TIG domain-containing protein [Candidatus Saccharimonadales bacterium]